MPARARILRSIATAGVAVGALVGVAGPAAADAPAPDPAQAHFEIQFLRETIDHHFAGVVMGQLCLQKATAPPPSSDTTLRQTCQEIVETQSREIEQLQTWLHDWYGQTEKPSIPPDSRGMIQRLRRAHGEAFDLEVSRGFILHHEMFLPEAARCADHAYHPALRDACHEMFETQQREIGIFRQIIHDHEASAPAH